MIRKTIKLLVLTSVVVGGAGFVMFGTDLGSYLGTVADSVKAEVEEQIPIDFELKRAEKLIRAIDPQIDSCKRDLARAEVDLEELHASVAVLEQTVAADERKLKAGVRYLDEEPETAIPTSFAEESGREALLRRRVERNLQRTMDAYRNNLAILKTKRALIERQSEAVEVAKQRLHAVRAEKENLADQVRALRTQKQWIETMAAGQRRFRLDDSALSQAKDALGKVKKRLDVAQKMLENEVAFHGEAHAALDLDPTRDVVREIHEHFAAQAGADDGSATIVAEDPVLRVR